MGGFGNYSKPKIKSAVGLGSDSKRHDSQIDESQFTHYMRRRCMPEYCRMLVQKHAAFMILVMYALGVAHLLCEKGRL